MERESVCKTEPVMVPVWRLGMGIIMTTLSVCVLIKVFLSFPPQVGGPGGPSWRPLPSPYVPFPRGFLTDGTGQPQAETPAASLTDPEALRAL